MVLLRSNLCSPKLGRIRHFGFLQLFLHTNWAAWGGFWARILRTATDTWELFTFICHAPLTAFHGCMAYLYLLTQRCEDCPTVGVPKYFRSDCGGARPGQEQPQHPPVMLSQ